MKNNIFLLAACFFAIVAEAQNDTIIKTNQIKASILSFTKFVDSSNISEYGFNSIKDLKQSKPGKQFKKYIISLSAVKNFKLGDTVSNIIMGYPSIEVALVNRNGKILNSIEFIEDTISHKWRASRYGSTPELAILRRVQDVIGDSIIRKGKLIRIPSLNISFIAISSNGGGLVFISLVDRPNLNLIRGQKLTASDAILKLVPYAKSYKNFHG